MRSAWRAGSGTEDARRVRARLPARALALLVGGLVAAGCAGPAAERSTQPRPATAVRARPPPPTPLPPGVALAPAHAEPDLVAPEPPRRATPPRPSPGAHRVQRGETLFRIARAAGTTPAALAALNGIAVDTPLSVGQLLIVPAGPDAAEPAAGPPPASSPETQGTELVAAPERLPAPRAPSATAPPRAAARTAEPEVGDGAAAAPPPGRLPPALAAAFDAAGRAPSTPPGPVPVPAPSPGALRGTPARGAPEADREASPDARRAASPDARRAPSPDASRAPSPDASRAPSPDASRAPSPGAAADHEGPPVTAPRSSGAAHADAASSTLSRVPDSPERSPRSARPAPPATRAAEASLLGAVTPAPAPQRPVPERSSPARGVRAGPLQWPLRGVLYARFGRKGKEPHDGIDLAAPAGTPVRTAAEGTVLFAGPQQGYGQLVIVEHARGLVTVYAHNRDMRVRTGQAVREGQVIATVGESGKTSGPHLHFEVRQDGEPVDPLKFLGAAPAS